MYRQMTTAVTAAVVLLLVSQASALDWDGSEECEQEAFDYYVKLMGYESWDESANKDDATTLGDLTYGFDNLDHYQSAGAPDALGANNPFAAGFLPYARSFSMMDQMIDMPTTSNTADDVVFELPDPSTIDYSSPEDLLYMPIKQMASLIESQTVSCVEVTEFFINQTKRLDPLLGIVSVALFDEAMETAAMLDAEIAEKGTRGALMCIPFALKDHHQIEDEPTTYGNILYYGNVQSEKSSVIHQLMSYGAIPIAKTVLGSFAWGSIHGWGACMSPYLNGQGCGSSCGSGSGAAAGIFPFAVSEETWGSIACPASFSFISGYLPSYGVTSRTGAGLLSMEFDHIGFHSRYISDYGVILNYMRTGEDPKDGDSVAFEFEDPAKIDPSSLSVLIVGEGASCSYGDMTCHKWDERYPLIKDALEAAGVSVDVKTAAEAKAMWSFNETYPSASLYDAVRTGDFFGLTMATVPWGELMMDELSMCNSRYCGYEPKAFNMPAKIYNYGRAAIIEFGKRFLNDPVWDQYDVIIDTDAMLAGDYDMHDSNFEQWVRTSKVFLMDHYEKSDLHSSGDTIEGSYVTLTAKPWDEAKSFRVGEIIQDSEPIKAKLMFPDFDKIEENLTGRTRCAAEFFSELDETKGMLANEDGTANPSAAWRYSYVGGCPEAGPAQQYIPDAWAAEEYVPPYLMEDPMPEHAIWNYDDYTTEEVCGFLPHFCDFKGIEYDNEVTPDVRRRKLQSTKRRRSPQQVHKELLTEMQL